MPFHTADGLYAGLFLTYHSFACSESLLPRRTSQTADKPKLEQLPPMEKKPSLPDIKLKMEFSPKKEPGATKTEPKWEVEEDVKPKQVFSVSDFEKGDLIEQLTAKNKLLLETISRLKEHIAEKGNERDNLIAEKEKHDLIAISGIIQLVCRMPGLPRV